MKKWIKDSLIVLFVTAFWTAFQWFRFARSTLRIAGIPYEISFVKYAAQFSITWVEKLIFIALIFILINIKFKKEK